MMWSFFGAGHGKGEHDGMGVVVKHWLAHNQLDRKGMPLNDVGDVVKLLDLIL